MVDSFEDEVGSEHHEFVVDYACIVVRGNGDFFLHDDVAGVDFVLEEEGGDACFGFAIDDCPIDWGCSAILWEE